MESMVADDTGHLLDTNQHRFLVWELKHIVYACKRQKIRKGLHGDDVDKLGQRHNTSNCVSPSCVWWSLS